MTKGIFLLAHGKRGYIFSAYNLAYSIKHYNHDIQIALVHDGCIEWLHPYQKDVFDILIPLPEEIKNHNGQVNPGWIKVSMYDLMPFDINLYLDVDALCFQNLDPVFEELEKDGGYYYTHVVDTHTIDKGRIIPNMIWAYADDIWAQYKLPQDAVLPCTNSSFQYVKKGQQAKELYEQIQTNLSDPIPLPMLRTQWGGTQPDELYLNIALAQKGITGKSPRQYMFLGYSMDVRPPHQLQKEYFILSTFGGRGFTKPRYIEFYDKLLINMHRKDGRNHVFKHYMIVNDKHANTKPAKTLRQAVSTYKMTQRNRRHEKINLFLCYYQDKNPIRKREIETAVQKNIDCKTIDKIYLVTEQDVTHSLPILKTQSRPTYDDMFAFANERSDEDTITIIANADIYFNSESIAAIKNVNFDNLAICLTRWNVTPAGVAKEYVDKGSQDVWIFKGHIKGNCKEQLGTPTCDHRVAFDLKQDGYKLANPSLDIKSYHLHHSGVRSYHRDSQLPGGKAFVERSDLKQIAKKNLLIIQPGHFGDILLTLPIARFYADAYNVDYQCPLQYHSLFRNINYCQPVEQANPLQYQYVIDLSFGLSKGKVNDWWLANKSRFNSFVEAKYELAKVDIEQRWNLKWTRDEKRENELFDLIGKTDYILVHDSGCNGKIMDFEGENIVRFEPIKDYNVFDWYKVIMSAKEIRCVDSLLSNFVEVINPDVPKEIYDGVNGGGVMRSLYKNFSDAVSV